MSMDQNKGAEAIGGSTNFEAVLRIHEEVATQIVEHDRVVLAPLRKLAPDDAQRFHLRFTRPSLRKYIHVCTMKTLDFCSILKLHIKFAFTIFYSYFCKFTILFA